MFSTVNLQPKNSSLPFFVLLLLSVRVSIYTQLSVVIIVKFTTQFSEKRLCSLSQQLYSLQFGLPFWVIAILKEHLHQKFFLRCTIKASACKITQQKQTTAPLEPSLLRDHFNGFFETIATIFKHTLALYIHD